MDNTKKYKGKEFCIDIECIHYDPVEHRCDLKRCEQTARGFYEWLMDNGFSIISKQKETD